MISDRIKALREKKGLTQAELANKLHITRSSINAWEAGISVPSTRYVVEMAEILEVSTDLILGVEYNNTIDIGDLTEFEKGMIKDLLKYFRGEIN